jgi:TorA maturation chaperone TorD
MTIPIERESLLEFRDLCSMLRLILLSEPGKELLDRLLAIEPVESNDDIERGLGMLCGEVRKNQDRLSRYQEERGVEFARLFLGPQHPAAVPYASFYLSETRQLMTEITIQVRGYYLDAGMTVTGLHRVPDDHIALELEFMAYLADEGVRNLESANAEAASAAVARLEIFYHEHLTKWLPLFAGRVQEGAESDFYRGTALALKGVAALYL